MKAQRVATETTKLEVAKAELKREAEWVSRQPKGRQAKNKQRVERVSTLNPMICEKPNSATHLIVVV